MGSHAQRMPLTPPDALIVAPPERRHCNHATANPADAGLCQFDYQNVSC
jgi:hypothetical protein